MMTAKRLSRPLSYFGTVGHALISIDPKPTV